MARVLIVDDSRSIRDALSAILEDAGFATEQAADGQDALNELQQGGPFDLALVDWHMPVMDGLTLVKKIRAEQKFAHMTLIMVTTETDSKRVYEALDAGAHSYIIKPFSPDTVLDVLEDAGFKVN